MLTICLPQITPYDVAVIFGIPCACAVVVLILGLLPITRRLMTGEMTDKQLRAYMAKEDAMWRAKSDKFEQGMAEYVLAHKERFPLQAERYRSSSVSV